MYQKKHTPKARELMSEKAKQSYQVRFKNQMLPYRAIPVQLLNLKTNELMAPFKTLLAAGKFLEYHTSRMIRKAIKNPNLILRSEWRVVPMAHKEFFENTKNEKN